MKNSKHSTIHLPQTPAHGEQNESPANDVQGEGDYESARAFNAAERKFVESGKVSAAARAAAPKSEAVNQELIAAERETAERARK